MQQLPILSFTLSRKSFTIRTLISEVIFWTCTETGHWGPLDICSVSEALRGGTSVGVTFAGPLVLASEKWTCFTSDEEAIEGMLSFVSETLTGATETTFVGAGSSGFVWDSEILVGVTSADVTLLSLLVFVWAASETVVGVTREPWSSDVEGPCSSDVGIWGSSGEVLIGGVGFTWKCSSRIGSGVNLDLKGIFTEWFGLILIIVLWLAFSTNLNIPSISWSWTCLSW